MKKFISFVFGIVFISHAAVAASPIQHISCSFFNSSKSDRVVVSFNNKNTGTLFVTTGFDDFGNDQNTGVLTLTRTAPSQMQNFSTFSAIWKAQTPDGSGMSVNFKFFIAEENILKASNSFTAHLSAQVLDLGASEAPVPEELICYSSLY